jgi:hypothetical protein
MEKTMAGGFLRKLANHGRLGNHKYFIFTKLGTYLLDVEISGKACWG